MSLPTTSVYIQHALHSIRYPTTPTPPSTSTPPPPHSPLPDSDSMKDDTDPPSIPLTSPHPNGLPEADDSEKSFVINIPPLEVTPPSSPSPSIAPHRVALRVDTDVRFSSRSSTSPPLSPKSPAKQSPPSTQSPDPSQHSPHKRRKGETNPSSSPSASPSSPSPHRLASVSPPKSPRASLSPRSPITRSPSASSPPVPLPSHLGGAIRQFWWPEGEPVSPSTRRKDDRRVRRLFQKAVRGDKDEEEKEEEGEEGGEEEETGDDSMPSLTREALYPLTTKVCGLSSYCTGALYTALLAHSRLHFPHYHLHDKGGLDSSKHEEAEEKSSSQSEMDMKDALSASSTLSSPAPPIHLDVFLSFYRTHIQPFDAVTRFFRVLRSSPTTRYLTRDNFKPIVADIVSRHPGLEFLQSTPEFQFKYAQTVIARIFYQVNVSGSERMTVHEIRQSNLLLMLGLLDAEDDINKLHDYFSYEHFYVIYCKFWELDSDHDGFIDVNDLSSYDDYALTSKVVERVIGGAGRPLLSAVKGKMNYLDFVVFLISEIDKSNPVSVDYWFNCLDLDEDGLVTGYEMEAFFEEQKQRIQSLSQEQITFVDILCQLIDMIKGGQEAGKDLLPLSSTPLPSASATSQLARSAALHLQPLPPPTFTKADFRSSHLASAFFNTLFNLNKFILSEQRDPIRIKQIHDTPQLSDWDRYAISGYYRLAEVDGEEGGGEEEVGEEEGENEEWRSRAGREEGGGGDAGEVYVREDEAGLNEEDEDRDGMEVDEHGGAGGGAHSHGDAHMTDSGDEEAKK